MTKNQELIEFIDKLIAAAPSVAESGMTDTIKTYLGILRNDSNTSEKPLFTDNGKKILKLLQDKPQVPMWKSRDIAEDLFIGSKTVSGSMRKLVTDGFVEKIGQNPIFYSITDKGRNITIED